MWQDELYLKPQLLLESHLLFIVYEHCLGPMMWHGWIHCSYTSSPCHPGRSQVWPSDLLLWCVSGINVHHFQAEILRATVIQHALFISPYDLGIMWRDSVSVCQISEWLWEVELVYQPMMDRKCEWGMDLVVLNGFAEVFISLLQPSLQPSLFW